MTKTQEDQEADIRDIIRSWGINGKDQHEQEILANTPRRWLKLMEGYSIALRESYVDFKTFESEYNQMVIVETKFYSFCEHHLVPYMGRAFIGYLPRRKVVGLSKLSKLIKHLFKKPSIQESVTEEIAKVVQEQLDTAGVAVVVRGFHLCVAMRYGEGWVTTSSVHGTFKNNPFAREEFESFVQPRLGEMKFD